MPFGGLLTVALIGAGSSIAGGALAGRKKTTTQEGTLKGTTTSTPSFTPEGQSLQQRLLNYQGGLLRDPAAGTGAINQAGIGRINRNFAGMPGRIATSMASRGFGSSGGLGTAYYDTESARLGNLSDWQAKMNEMIFGRQQQGAAIGKDLLEMNRGTTTTQDNRTTGNYTGPSTMAGDALTSGGNALSDLSRLLMFGNMLKTQNQPAGGAYTPSDYSGPGFEQSQYGYEPGAGAYGNDTIPW